MYIGYIIAGVVFLFNPNVNIIDILPDFIGYALILKGISKAQHVNLSFASAYEYFRYLLFVEILKIPSLLLYRMINVSSSIPFDGTADAQYSDAIASVGSYTDYTPILIATLLFGIVEIILGIIAWGNFFDGIKTEKLSGVIDDNMYSSTKSVTIAYTVIKPVLCIIPELSCLSTGSSGYVTDKGIFALSEYRNILIICSCVIGLVIGVAFLFKVCKYLTSLKHDNEFISGIEKKYSLLGIEKTVRASRISTALLLYATFALFVTEITIDGVSIVPLFISGAVLIASFAILWKNRKNDGSKRRMETKVALILSIVYTIVASLRWFISLWMQNKYYKGIDNFSYDEVLDGQISKHFEAQDNFTLQCIVSAVSGLILASLTVMVFLNIKEFIAEFEKVPTEGGSILKCDVRDATSRLKKLTVCNFVSLFIGIISAASGAAMTYFTVFMPWWWSIDILIRAVYSTVLFICVLSLRSDIIKSQKQAQEQF